MTNLPIIDDKKCISCAGCIQICPMQVFAKEKDKVIVKKPKECIGCRACEVQCSKGAIKIIEEKPEAKPEEPKK